MFVTYNKKQLNDFFSRPFCQTSNQFLEAPLSATDKHKSLKQSPVETEKLRLNIFEINQTKDPLSSFLQIIFGADTSLVVDGRRLYTMNARHDKNIEQTIIEIDNYYNLWADHKRSDFEKITFDKKDEGFLPFEILIYFDGRVFKLKED